MDLSHRDCGQSPSQPAVPVGAAPIGRHFWILSGASGAQPLRGPCRRSCSNCTTPPDRWGTAGVCRAGLEDGAAGGPDGSNLRTFRRCRRGRVVAGAVLGGEVTIKEEAMNDLKFDSGGRKPDPRSVAFDDTQRCVGVQLCDGQSPHVQEGRRAAHGDVVLRRGSLGKARGELCGVPPQGPGGARRRAPQAGSVAQWRGATTVPASRSWRNTWSFGR
jgi:hypothetical protein